MYKLILRRWIEGLIGTKEIDLLVRTKYLTQAQADAIKATERQVSVNEVTENIEAD